MKVKKNIVFGLHVLTCIISTLFSSFAYSAENISIDHTETLYNLFDDDGYILTHQNSLEMVLIILFCLLAIILYFLPTIIAFKRDHEYKIAIILINVFCGIFAFPWFAIIAWSLWPRQTRSDYDQLRNSQVNYNFSPHHINPPPFPSNEMNDNQFENLEKIGRLRQQGILTEEEFEKAKRKILKF